VSIVWQIEWIFAAFVTSQVAQRSLDRGIGSEITWDVLRELEHEMASFTHWRAYDFLFMVLSWYRNPRAIGVEHESKIDDVVEARREVPTTLFAHVAEAIETNTFCPVVDFCLRENQKCPIEATRFLLDMYVRHHYEDWEGGAEPQVRHHLKLLSQQGFSEILRLAQSRPNPYDTLPGWKYLEFLAWV
jgi:hypothetical protein